MFNRVIFGVVILILSLVLIGNTQAKPIKQSKSFDVKSGGTLIIRSDIGSIDIDSHDQESVKIEVKTKGIDPDDFEIEFAQDGSDVKVEGDYKYRAGGYRVSAQFIVKVPRQYNIDLDTGGGSIELDDLNGTVRAKTSGGSINLGKIEGDVNVNTSGGSIHVEEVAGNINAHTSGGSVTAKITTQPTSNCRLSTSGGSVTAYLSPSVEVDLDAGTSGGRVRSDFDVEGRVSKRRIKGKINGGGPELKLKTSGGNVKVKKL